jgi:ribosomal protein S28E/S33
MQDEDHEAAEAILNRIIEAASKAGADGVLPAETVRVECLRATYALRVFPSRVGSVAVEDVGRLVETLREATGHVEHDGLRARMHAALAEFSRSSTDRPEQPEPDVLGGQHE